MYQRYIKRAFDFLLALVAIIVLSPIMLIVAILVRTKLGSPVLFKQQRPGKNEKIFNMYKFRTMTDERDENGELCSDEIRLTDFGKKLRSTSLDELPELFNILFGDMSIVGPRPYLPREQEDMGNYYNKIIETKPGITGLWQVSGRSNTTFEERMKFDLKYNNEFSVSKHIEILLKTAVSVAKKEGAE